MRAIDRLRLVHATERKTVYILCSVPVDELVTWKQLTGDRRLNDAMAECDKTGGPRYRRRPSRECWE